MGDDVEEGEPWYTVGGNVDQLQPLWEIIWELPPKLKLKPTYDTTVPFLSIHLNKTVTLIQKDICTSMCIPSLFKKAKIQKQPKCPSTDEQIKKMYIHICNGNYTAINMNEILSFAKSMEFHSGHYTQ